MAKKPKQQTPLDRINGHLVRLGKSQQWLIGQSGIGQGTLSTAKKTGKLNLDTLTAVAPILGTTVGELLGEGKSGQADGVYRKVALRCLASWEFNERHIQPDLDIEDGFLEDIAANGLLQNLVVFERPKGSENYAVAAGSRRLSALQMLEGRKRLPKELQDGIPCRVLPNEEAALKATVIENLQREDTHYLDRAEGLHRLKTKLKMSSEQIAIAVKCSIRSVQQHFQLLSGLNENQKAAAWRGDLGFREALDLVQEKKVAKAPAKPAPASGGQRLAPKEPTPPILKACGVGPSAARPSETVSPAKPVVLAKPGKRIDLDVEALEREIEAGLGYPCRIEGGDGCAWTLRLTTLNLDQFDHVLGLLLPNRGK